VNRATRWLGLLAGLGLTSASLSSGFIWACGAPCVRDPVVWTAENRGLLVFAASFAAWWGYLLAHYAWTGAFIDASAHDTSTDAVETGNDVTVPTLAGVFLGVGVLVLGMVLGVVFIQRGNHLLTNVGGVFFLGGFVIAHYFETGTPL
jgi:hypothetical protein